MCLTFWSRADLTLIFSHPRDWFRFLELLSWTQMTTGSCGGHTATRDELPLVWSWKGRSRRGSLVAKGLLSWREGGSRGSPDWTPPYWTDTHWRTLTRSLWTLQTVRGESDPIDRQLTVRSAFPTLLRLAVPFPATRDTQRPLGTRHKWQVPSDPWGSRVAGNGTPCVRQCIARQCDQCGAIWRDCHVFHPGFSGGQLLNTFFCACVWIKEQS